MPWTCPNCNTETELGYNTCIECGEPRPGTRKQTNITAQCVLKPQQVNGVALESLLDLTAILIVVVASVVAMGMTAINGIKAMVLAFLTVLASLFFWLLLRSLAEIIRLLKRLNGMNFAGQVSGSHLEMQRTCGRCGTRLADGLLCHGCGAKIVDSADRDSS